MPRDTYTKAEADALIGRAARLQTTADVAGTEPTLTLEEIKEAAAAAGIASGYVDLAARLPKEIHVAAPPPYAGIPVGVVRTRLVEGKLDEARWQQIVADLRRKLGGMGKVEAGPGLFAWHRSPLHITAEQHGDFVRLVASARWDGDVRGLVGVAAVMLLVSAGMAGGALFSSGGPFSAGTALYVLLIALAVAWTWPRYRRKEARVGAKFDDALDHIEGTLRTGRAATGMATPVSTIALPEDDEVSPDVSTARRVRA